MPNAIPVEPLNPTITNPPVALATGVVPRGDGFGQAADAFVFDLGQQAYVSAAMTTVITGAPTSVTVQLQSSMDGNSWTTIATSTSTTGDVQFAIPGQNQFTSLRVNVSALVGGSTPKITVALAAYATPTGVALGSTGTTNPVTAQSAATTGNGTTADFGSAKRSISFQVTATGTVTAGQVTLEVSADGVTFSVPPAGSFQNNSAATLADPYVLVSNTTALFTATNVSVRYARARISTAVTGGATVTALISAS